MNLTIDNFTKNTGFRFRVNRDQKAEIKAGTLTREQAFQSFLEGGGLERMQARPQQIPDSVYLNPTLTLDNFSSVVKDAIGTTRRFRASRDQHERITAKTLTREQALAEIVAIKQAAASATETTDVTETIGS